MIRMFLPRLHLAVLTTMGPLLVSQSDFPPCLLNTVATDGSVYIRQTLLFLLTVALPCT